jgi:protein phosphatase
VLTRAVGTEKSVIADIYEIQCFKDDILVISSDGLSDKVSPEEILDLAYNDGPDAACQKLVELANYRGGDDNITVIVLKVKLVKNSQYKINRFLALVRRNFFRFLTRIKFNRMPKYQRAARCRT